MRPLLGEYVILRGDPDAPVARRVLRGSGGTAAPRAEGRFWVGTTVREAGYPSHPSAASVADILARWTAILPGLADLGFERAGRACARHARPDADRGAEPGGRPRVRHWGTAARASSTRR